MAPVSGLPPVVVEGHVEGLHAPDDGLWVEGLADAGEEAQGGEVALLRGLGAGLHHHADRRRGRVPDRHLVLLDEVVPDGGAEAAFVDEVGDAVGPGRDDAVGGAGDPAGVGGAPVEVVLVEVEGPLARGVLLEHRVVPVDCALGLACRAGRVVHDRVVVAGGVDVVEDIGGGRHEVLVADVAVGEGLGAAPVLVDDDDVLEVGAGGEDAGDALAEVGER